jgi:hypothetical protein
MTRLIKEMKIEIKLVFCELYGTHPKNALAS